MRISVREQLAFVVLVAAITPLSLLAFLTWVNNSNFVQTVKSQGLSLTASLKAAQISSDLILFQTTCSTIVTRILFQNDIRSFYSAPNITSYNWTIAYNDLLGGLTSGGLSALLQVVVFSRNQTGSPHGLLNVTTQTSTVILPETYPNGTHYRLGDTGPGYPPSLYPDISYTPQANPEPSDGIENEALVFAFPDVPLNKTSALLLGPLQINNSYAMMSLTMPIIDNQNSSYVLGYMTVVAAATSLIIAAQSREGLDNSGTVIIISPDRPDNHFENNEQPATQDYMPSFNQLDRALVRYVFTPQPGTDQIDRHTQYTSNITQHGSSSFYLGRYPAALAGFSEQNTAINNASSMLSTVNENGDDVAVGWARPQTPLVDWLLLVEHSHNEAFAPIITLRNIILACVFGSFGAVLLSVIPLAHFGVRPIRRLRDATGQTLTLPELTINESERYRSDEPVVGTCENGTAGRPLGLMAFWGRLWLRPNQIWHSHNHDVEKIRGFRIPGKVEDRKHIITDELTELTCTFNNMSDELLVQYNRLEERVAERTRELESSKQAAEAANESKTLFIANISHELKTPLNGILGMCAVCMGEDDVLKIKQSLQIVYKSGDLLLHLLNDLLTFSKNQIGKQLILEEKDFRLGDIRSQLIAIFDKQARDGGINFSVKLIDTPAKADDPAIPGTRRIKDLCLRGDQYRILQVVINLVSNSLKFTPENGKVAVRISCSYEAETCSDQNKSTATSQSSMQGSGAVRENEASLKTSYGVKRSASSSKMESKGGTTLMINPLYPESTTEEAMCGRATLIWADTRSLILKIEVEDTGPGIPANLQIQIFEPFVQADLGLNRKYGGTGLGLSICSQLTRLMNGSISLVSTEGQGTTFTVTLPLKLMQQRSGSRVASDAYATNVSSKRGNAVDADIITENADIVLSTSTNKQISFENGPLPRLADLSQPCIATKSTLSEAHATENILRPVSRAMNKSKEIQILVAEDNDINQEVVLRMLKLEDIHNVVMARDGQKAYDIVKESMEKGETFNLILMDIQMPNLDGLQSTRLIRQLGYSAPIVALTAFAEENNIKDCYDSGMDMFLSKPIRRHALKQVLKKFVTVPEELGDDVVVTGDQMVDRSGRLL